MDVMEHIADNIDTQITLLHPLLEVFEISKMRLWYDDDIVEEYVVDNITIRCSNHGKKLVYM